MDAVITYVDGNDPVWRESFAATVGVPAIEKRYRDWGTLRYLIRGIRSCMPFIRTIHLVVSGESQVPAWVNREKLHVVLHSDIIPQQFLPVFNSAAIEMFLHRIPGLDEEYIYLNDDTFPVMDCVPEDFFRDGRAVLGFHHHFLVLNLYKRHTRNSDHMARKALGMRPGLAFVRPQHTCTTMLRSACEELYLKAENEILASVTPLREPCNFNQYMYLDYQYYSGRVVPHGKISNRHLSLGVKSADQVCVAILNPTRKIACINDVKLGEEQYASMRKRILEAFESRFPEKTEEEL